MSYPPGLFPYSTERFSSQLTILDPSGGVALFTRRQRIRFLDDDVKVFLDRVWGDGLLLHRYSVGGAMRIVDFIRSGNGYVVVLALPRAFGRGEVLEVVTERRILGAFTDREAYVESVMPVPTDLLKMEVVAPSDRRIVEADVIAPSLRGLKARQRSGLLALSVRQPDVNVPYRFSWSWN